MAIFNRISWSALYGYGCEACDPCLLCVGKFGDGEDGVLGEVLAEGFWVYWMSRSRIV